MTNTEFMLAEEIAENLRLKDTISELVYALQLVSDHPKTFNFEVVEQAISKARGEA